MRRIVAGGQVRKSYLAGALRSQMKTRRAALAGREIPDFDGGLLIFFEDDAAERSFRQSHAHAIGGRDARVQHRHTRFIRLAKTNAARMTEREREIWIPNQNGSGRSARDFNDTSSKPFKVGREFDVHRVQTFLQTFHEKFRLTGFASVQAKNVVRGSKPPVRTSARNRHVGMNVAIRPDPREAQRIVAGIIEITRWNLVWPRRQLQCGANIDDTQSGILRRRVFREQLNAEKLI